MARLVLVAMMCVTLVLSSGCQKKTAAVDPAPQTQPGSTKVLEAVDLVGYDGKKLRKSVDRIKEANEKRGQELQKLTDGAPDQ